MPVVDPNTPVRLDQPDGDTVYLPPWGFIVEHVKDLVVPITLMIGDMNDSLSAIEDRIDYWLEQQQPEEENGG